MLKYLPADEFKREARAGRDGGCGVVVSSVSVRGINEKARTAGFIFSDGNVDRVGDKIDPAGWELADFRRNPVALFAHDSKSLPIGRAKNVRVEGGRLVGDVEFVPPDTSQFADRVFRMVLGGFLRAVSVGFLPMEWSWSRDPARLGGLDFKRQALLEISLVPIPAHQNALLIGASAPAASQGPAEAARARRRRTLQLMRLGNGQ